MTTVAAPIDVFRAAFPLVGAGVPSTIDDQSPEAIAAKAGYETMVAAALSWPVWSFAVRSGTMPYKGASGSHPAYSYTFPTGVLQPRSIMLSGVPFRDYELREGEMLCNVTETTNFELIHTFRANEGTWPAMFAEAIILRLAGYLARGLLDRANQGNDLRAQSDALLKKAAVVDRRSSKGWNAQPDAPLVSAWRGSGGRRSTLTEIR